MADIKKETTTINVHFDPAGDNDNPELSKEDREGLADGILDLLVASDIVSADVTIKY